MRRYLWNLLRVAVVATGFVAAACSDSDGEEQTFVEPNFPAPVTIGARAGEPCRIAVSPNQAWTVTIDSEKAGRWFVLEDAGMPAYRVQGEAGEHEIVVAVSDLVENDEDHSIDVTMTMAGRSQVIATVTLGKVERAFNLYRARTDGNGNFTPVDGEYPYETKPADPAASLLSFKWPEAESALMIYPVKVQANFRWHLLSKPEWVSTVTPAEGKIGQEVKIELKGDPTAYPLDTTESELVFCDYDHPEITFTYRMKIPGCRDKGSVSISRGSTFAFNAAGEYGNPAAGVTTWTYRGPSFKVVAPAIPDATGEKQLPKVFLIEEKELGPGIAMHAPCDWVQSSAKVTSDRNVLVETEYTLTATENPSSFRSSARKALLLVVPIEAAAGVASVEDLIEADPVTYMPQLKSEYREFVTATLLQDAPTGVFSVRDLAALAQNGDGFRKLNSDQDEDRELMDAIDPQGQILDIYRLTYATDWSEVMLTYPVEYENCFVQTNLATCVKAYGEEGFMAPIPSLEQAGLTVNAVASITDNSGNRSTAPGFSVTMDPDAAGRYLVFRDLDNRPYAAIYCERSTGGGEAGGSFTVEFSYPELVQHATLEQIVTEEDIMRYAEKLAGHWLTAEEWAQIIGERWGMGQESGLSQYVLTYSDATARNATLKVQGTFTSIDKAPYTGVDWLSFEGASETEFNILMKRPAEEDAQIGQVQFRSGEDIKCVIYCLPAF